MSDGKEVARGLNMLVLEGGGARGLSSLIILDQMMDRLQDSLGLARPPNVRDYFDIVAGSGTGAVIACMVGRLGIPVKDAIYSYTKLSKVFSDRKLIGTTTFKTSKLRDVIKEIIRGATGDENTRMVDTSTDGKRCRTMVFTMSRHNMNAGIPCIFRSYQGTANQVPDCAIWEVLCASLAHPELFKPINIGEGHMRESFIDGGLGCTNPIAHVLTEAKALFPSHYVSSVLSIGAGHPQTIQIPDSSPLLRLMPTSVPIAMKQIATDGERVAQEMSVRFRATTDVYFRFSVDQGMQSVGASSWERLSEVSAHTRAYMQMAEISGKMGRAVKTVLERKEAVEMSQIDGHIRLPLNQRMAEVKTCPMPTPVFTGRQGDIERIKACISCGDRQRCVFVLYGLGGAGKTQLALKAVEATWDMWSQILFVDATSHETTTNALETLAKAQNVGQTHQDMIRWLGSRRERWLMVFDNADDPSLHLGNFFPKGNHGSIIVTTRVADLSLLARGTDPNFPVSNMDPRDALQLLLKTADLQGTPVTEVERKAAVQLLEASSLGYLALAIVQAGAYIRCSKRTISQYCAMFFKHRRATLEKYGELLVKVDDYQRSVYTTWHMSYIRLSSNAQRLLHLMAFMHHDGITEDIFRRGAIVLSKYRPAIPMTGEEVEVTAHVVECLRPYLDPTGAWDSGTFLSTITELVSYSLVSYDRTNGAYTMHVLVHDWASTVTNHPLEVAVQHTALLLAVSIDYGDTMESLAYKRGVEIHVNRVLERLPRPSANNAALFAEAYYRARKWKQEQKLREVELEGKRQALGDEHDLTLTTMHNLALTYWGQAKFKQAEQMLSQVVTSRKRLSGEVHASTLTSMSELANTYFFLGRYKEALVLQVQVVDSRNRTLGGKDPATLWSMQYLANTYRSQGRYDQAEGLLVQVVDARKQLFGEEHPDTLSSMYGLALSYKERGRLGQAEALLVQVLADRKRVSGAEHPNTLTAMHALASTYYHQRRYEQAEMLQMKVVTARKRVSGDEHPDTLVSMGDLALTYCDQGRYDQAEALHVQVLDGKKGVYGEDHPETLTTMYCLAYTYWRQGRHSQAEELQVHLVDASKRVLGSEHPRTLLAMNHLAATYQSLGGQRRKQYEELQAEIHRLEALSQ